MKASRRFTNTNQLSPQSICNMFGPLAVSLIDHPSMGIVLMDVDGCYLLVNESAAKLFGEDPQTLVGKRHRDLFNDFSCGDCFRKMKERKWICFSQHTSTDKPHEAAGFWDCSMSLCAGDDGQPIGYVLLLHEVSSFQYALQQAAKQRKMFNCLLDQIPAGVIIAQGYEGRITMMNSVARQVYDGILTDHVVASSSRGGYENAGGYGFIHESHPLLLTIRSGRGIRGATVCLRKVDGHRVTLQMDCDPLGAFDGEPAAIAVLQDITDHAEHERELEQENRMLLELGREKDYFLANVSHELKTPLTAILGWAKIARDMENADLTIKALQVIMRNAERQALLVDELLTLSSCYSGQLLLHLESLNVRAVCEESISHVCNAMKYSRKSIALAVPQALTIVADPARLRQVLDNIVTNAIKFSTGKGAIVVEAREDNEWIQIDVSDTGIGLSASQIANIFRPFWQADTSPSRKFSGTGIGLTVVKELVALHGGEVAAASKGINQGATFTVRLPRRNAEQLGTADGLSTQSIL